MDAAVVETKSTAAIDVSLTGSDFGLTVKAHATSVDNGTMNFNSTDPTPAG